MNPQVNQYGFKVGDKFKVIVADSFKEGAVVTLTHDDGTPLPEFTDVDGLSSWEFYDYLELIKETPSVKVGDRVKIISEGSNSVGSKGVGTYYKVGQEGIVTQINTYSVSVDLASYGLPLCTPLVNPEDIEVLLEDPIELAEIALAKAKSDLEAAIKAKDESHKFTEADVKNLMVVSYKGLQNNLRLVIFSREQNIALFTETDGTVANRYKMERLVEELNTMYTKTTLTLKDFANA